MAKYPNLVRIANMNYGRSPGMSDADWDAYIASKEPVTIYPEDDLRSNLPPRPEGYDVEDGQKFEPIDSSADIEAQRVRVPQKVAPTPRRPVARAPDPDEPLNPTLAALVSGAGDVADRAQAQMEAGPPPSPGGGRLAGFMGGAAQSASMGAATPQTRKPLVPPNGAAVPQEVADFAAKRAAPEAQRSFGGADLERGLAAALENVHAGMDTATNMRTPGYGGALREDAQRQDDQVAAAKAYALKKLGLDRQYAQDATRNEMEREKMRLAAQPKPTAPVDPLDAEKKKAEIAKLEAETAKLKRRGGGAGGSAAPAGGDPLGVPGFTRAPGAPAIKREEAEAMRGMVAAEQAMEKPIDAMLTAKGKTGREFSMLGMGEGPDYAAQAGPYSQMILNIKELAKSGALDEQSERVAQGMVPTPDDSPAAAAEKIKSLRAYVHGKVEAKANSLGYSRAGGEAAPGTPAAPQAPFPGAKRVRRSDGRTGWWDGKSPLPAGVEVVNG